jgi:hypothetical protein
MKIPEFFKRRQLVPLWTYSTKGILWRLMIADMGFVLGEDRNPERREVSFFCLNAENGDVLWEGKQFEEPWWIGVEAVVRDRVYLHGYKKTDSPQHYKIFAIDLGTGKEFWRNEEYSFLYATADKVVVFRELFERRQYFELDAATGVRLGETQETSESIILHRNDNCGRRDFLFPEVLLETHESYEEIRRIVSRHAALDALAGHIEFVRTGGKLIASYHAAFGVPAPGRTPDLRNHLCVIDEHTQSLVYADVLNASTPAVVPDSFFIDRSILYFVKERRTFAAVNLESEPR